MGVEHRTVTPTDRLHSLCGRHSRGPQHTLHTYLSTKKNMTASKGDTSASCEKRKRWASIIKRTISFRQDIKSQFCHLSRSDKDNTNGHPSASSSGPVSAKSQSRRSLSSKRGSLDSTGSISSFNSSYYERRSSQTPPQEFWW